MSGEDRPTDGLEYLVRDVTPSLMGVRDTGIYVIGVVKDPLEVIRISIGLGEIERAYEDSYVLIRRDQSDNTFIEIKTRFEKADYDPQKLQEIVDNLDQYRQIMTNMEESESRAMEIAKELMEISGDVLGKIIIDAEEKINRARGLYTELIGLGERLCDSPMRGYIEHAWMGETLAKLSQKIFGEVVCNLKESSYQKYKFKSSAEPTPP